MLEWLELFDGQCSRRTSAQRNLQGLAVVVEPADLDPGSATAGRRYLSSRSSTSLRPGGPSVTMPVALFHSTALALWSRSRTRR